MRPRQKGLREHRMLKQFSSSAIKTKGRVNHVRMEDEAYFSYDKHAATLGATHLSNIYVEMKIEVVHDVDANGKSVHYEVPVRKLHVEETEVLADPALPHQPIYTRGKGNEWNASIPRVWTIAKLYQGLLRGQQKERFQFVDMHRHAGGGIRMFFTQSECFFVEIDTRRGIERVSKTYPNTARAKQVFKVGRITWRV